MSDFDDNIKLNGCVKAVAELIKSNGGRALMVGGAVRDIILGREPRDTDVEVFGIEPIKLIEILKTKFRLDLVGQAFGVIKLHDYDVDIAVPRCESKRGPGHKGFEIYSDPYLSVEEAAARRDFTINAIYLDPLTKEFTDPYNGREDIKNAILRHVSSKFTEDPLRVLRGMQFVARFGLVPAHETICVCRDMTPEGLPPERLYEEWVKLITKGNKISKGLDFLRDVGWVKYYPELEALISCPQDPQWHSEGSVWNHTLRSLDEFAQERIGVQNEDVIVGFAVLCHDFGKPATTMVENDRIRSKGHDEAGVVPTLSFLSRLTASEEILKSVPPLVAAHMAPYSIYKAGAGDSAIRRLSVRVGRIDRLIRVASADNKGRQTEDYSSAEAALQWLSDGAERLRVTESKPKPVLQGRDLIALGYKPSPKFGVWLKLCYEAQLDGKVTTLHEATEYFKSIAENCNDTED